MRIFTILALFGAFCAQGASRATFTENNGQWPQSVLYRVMLPNGALFVEREAFTYVLQAGGDIHSHGTAGHVHETEPYHAHAFQVHFVDGHAQGHSGGVKQPHYENYFLGANADQWGTGCAVFGEVILYDVWPGIDLRLDGSDGLKYELIVNPGADPDQVLFRYEGPDELALKDGGLVVTTTAGNVVEEAPFTFQQQATGKHTVRSRYMLSGDELRFKLLSDYDTTLPLIIDPTLSFASYSGSNGNNFGFTATYDAGGHLYGGGIVFAAGYPTMLGVLDETFNGGTIDVGVSKWSSDGASLVWSTYYGGSSNEAPHSMVVNEEDELFVMGSTGSNDLPTTAGCFDNTYGGGTELIFTIGYGYGQPNGTDLFVAHFNSAATALIGSTYVGGVENDGVNNTSSVAHNYGDSFRGEIIVDATGNPIVASTTASSGLPVVGGPQATYGGGAQDGYCFRLDPTLSSMLWSTYIGGNGVDAAYGVQVDSGGELFVTGGSTSANLPMVGTPFQATASGNTDGFIMRYSTGGALVGSTHVGTSSYDQCYFVQLNTSDEVFVVGQTHGNFPVTPGKYSVPNSSQFIQKFDHALENSLWSTRFGNGDPLQDMSPTAFLVSDCGQIYFSGWASSVNSNAGNFSSTTNGLEVTSDAFQTTTDGNDLYLILLDPEATGLNYATFFGGDISSEHVDGGTSRFDKNGVVYQAVCAGCQNNDDFPTTPGAWSNTNNSTGCNLGVLKFDLSIPVASIDIDGASEVCFPALVQFTNNSSGGNTYAWDFGDGGTSSEFAPAHTYLEEGEFVIVMEMTDPFGCTLAASDTLEITSIPPPVATVDPVTPICPGNDVQLFASDGIAWEWIPAEGLSDPTAQAPIAMVDSTITYQLILTGTCGTDTTSILLTLSNPQGNTLGDAAVCVGSGVTIGATGGGSYSWSPTTGLSDPLSSSPVASPLDTTQYTVEITTPDGCLVSDSLLVYVYSDVPEKVLSDTLLCAEGSVQLFGPEAAAFTWQPAASVDEPNSSSPFVTPEGPTWFTVLASNACGSIIDSAFVDIHIPDADAWPDSTVCPNETVQIFASEGSSFAWSPSQGLSDPSIRTPVATVTGAITYEVVLTDEFGCPASASLTLGTHPPSIVRAGPDRVIDLGDEVQLSATGIGTFIWEPTEGLDRSDIASPIARPLETITYTVTLTDGFGCKSTDEVVVILPGSLFIPNTFTPNGDGYNDQFGALGTDLKTIELSVFNRWGELIWTTEQLDGRWDGTYKGTESPIDTYVWKIRATEITGKTHDQMGHVNLVR